VEEVNQLGLDQRQGKMADALASVSESNAVPHFFAWLICSAIAVLMLVILWMTFAIAWLINRTDIPFRSLIFTFLAITVIIPGLVKAMGWIMLLSPRAGLINRFLMGLLNLEVAPFDIYNIWGMAFIQGLMLTPTLCFLISGPMRTIDPALEEAAEVVGANRWKTLLWVTFPMLWPGILGGIIYVFMTAIALFEVASLLGGLGEHPVLATELFLAVQPHEGADVRYGVAGIYGLLIVIPSLIALFFYFRSIQQAHRYVAITGKGYRPKIVNLGRSRYPALLFVFLYVALAVFLPLLALLWASLLPSLRMPSVQALSLVTLQNYKDIFYISGGFHVLRISTVLVVSVSFLVLFFSFMVSWIVVRTHLRTRRMLDTIAMLPHAVPGLGWAFALLIVGIMVYKWLPWLPFYNTIWIIIAGNVLNRLSYATRITNAALLQVGQELEDAALICGANKWKSMWRVMVPLIRPSLVYAGLWTGLLVFREVSIALLLRGPDNVVLATQLWNVWWRGDLSEASAMSIVLVLIMSSLILILYGTTGRVGEVRTGIQ